MASAPSPGGLRRRKRYIAATALKPTRPRAKVAGSGAGVGLGGTVTSCATVKVILVARLTKTPGSISILKSPSPVPSNEPGAKIGADSAPE
jgi:hypothetical protein